MPIGGSARVVDNLLIRSAQVGRTSKEASTMHPSTMQLMAEVRAQEMLQEARAHRSTRRDKVVVAALRRIFTDPSDRSIA
jgi:hypothetical protein